uniref:alpha-1,2-Mannosidase n=1 Tax=Syphacia muris TaxID=451379 RepID=A0A0N5AWZ4_9BILA
MCFSLTLVDTLDTLVVIGELDEFERAVKLVVENTRFNSDIVVSVFETNIRMVGGLLSGHILAKLIQSKQSHRLLWYNDQLLQMARELADRLLPAFNTTSGVPYSRINLRFGMQSSLREQRDTCTACGGTMLLEFAALSRLTGIPVYEEKARKAMDFLWAQRHRGSNLMGTVLNVHSGDWVLRDAGIGAGIDSYYEYCLKAYILLGEDDYLYRFNKHYEGIMRYVNKGPLFVDVHMHKPTVAARSFMDALLAFWPGLQVLKGDLKSAIEFHETLNLVIQKHRFLPEAFTHDLQVHWGQHPLRPEFIESTYLLYRATKDPYYLRVAKNVMDSLNKYGRVKCGFAGVKDLRTMSQEDRMDSFVLSETFKYLYMIFAELPDMVFDPDNYVLTTEAHFLPLNIADIGDSKQKLPRRILIDPDEVMDKSSEKRYRSACPIEPLSNSLEQVSGYAHFLRLKVRNIISKLTRQSASANSASCPRPSERLRAWAFSSSNSEHIRQLQQMGIEISVQADGRLQLTHIPTMASIASIYLSTLGGVRDSDTTVNSVTYCYLDESEQRNIQKAFFSASLSHAKATHIFSLVMLVVMLWFIVMFVVGIVAVSTEWAKIGIDFMQEMVQIASQLEQQETGPGRAEVVVEILSQPYFGQVRYKASPAQFGPDWSFNQIEGTVVLASPFRACRPLFNKRNIKGNIALVQRQDCLFQEKARFAQEAGAVAVIIVDNTLGTSAENSLPFAMSGNNTIEDDIKIPVVFLFNREGEQLIHYIGSDASSVLRISGRPINPSFIFEQFMLQKKYKSGALKLNAKCFEDLIDMKEPIVYDASVPLVMFNFYFNDVSELSDSTRKKKAVEKNIEIMKVLYGFRTEEDSAVFFNCARKIGSLQLGLNLKLTQVELGELMSKLGSLRNIGKEQFKFFGTAIRVAYDKYKLGFCWKEENARTMMALISDVVKYYKLVKSRIDMRGRKFMVAG